MTLIKIFSKNPKEQNAVSNSYQTNSKKLEKLFSREHNLLYFELWNKSDRIGMKLIGEEIRNNLFIVNPPGSQGSVWYDPPEMARLKEKLINHFSSADGKKLLDQLRKYQEENWSILKPYILGKKFIQNWPELKRFYTASANYWISMNSFIWETMNDQRMPAFVKKTVLAWRKRSEQYSERANALEFIDTTYPHLHELLWFVTLDEFEKIIEGKAPQSEMQKFHRRRAGCFLLNGVIYPLDQLDQQLKEHRLELHNISGVTNKLTGTVAHPGLARGLARIIMGFNDLKKLKKDDILVAPMTSPDYVKTMRHVAAIITDEGGVLSHAAITSREIGIPCIIGTKIATQVIKNGDLVEVDANKGIVKILKK